MGGGGGEQGREVPFLKPRFEKKLNKIVRPVSLCPFLLVLLFISKLFAGQLLACGSVKLDRWSGTAGRHWYSSTELQAIQSSICSLSENTGEIVRPPPPPQRTPLKSSQVAIPLLSLFCSAAVVIKVKYVLCLEMGPLRTTLRLSLHRSSTRQEQLDLSSAVWNTYSVTFLSGCAEVEIWAIWTCLLLENRFLRRPVKLLSLETWLTIRDGASVLASFRNQLRCVFPHGSQCCICICVSECMCMCVLKYGC